MRAADEFRAALVESLSLDLRAYYITRAGAYGENWLPREIVWTDSQFTQLRRELAQQIARLTKPK